MNLHCTSVAAAHDDCKLAKLCSENLSSTGRGAVPLWSTGGISPRTESVCSGYSSPEEGSPEDAFMQRCQQQIARIVAASSGDGVETQLPMLSRMGQLPAGAHMRLSGAHLRLASSLSAVTEPRTLASDTAYESRNGRKRDWQVTGGEELPQWRSGSAKFAKPDDWLPAAPEMLQPDLSVALGELAGASAQLLPPLPAHKAQAPRKHKLTHLSPRWQMIFLISRQSWGLACSRMATATPTSPRSCERQDAWYSLAHGRERCVEQCSPHASATCAVRCEISGGEISGGAPSGPWGRGDVFRLGVATALFCSCARRANTPDTWARSPRCMIHIDGQFMMVLIEGRTISQGWLAISV
jgi:hypothetical protein